MKLVKQAPALDLSTIAENFVDAHVRHREALERSSLAYLDRLMDALQTSPQRTVREIANDLLDVVPDLSEREAFSLVRAKYLGIGLDSEAA
jgi:hypothetical protein